MKQYLWYQNWRHIFIKRAAIITRTAMKQSVKLNNTLYEQFRSRVSLCALYVYSTVWSIIWKLSMVCTSLYSCSNKISFFFLSFFLFLKYCLHNTEARSQLLNDPASSTSVFRFNLDSFRTKVIHDALNLHPCPSFSTISFSSVIFLPSSAYLAISTLRIYTSV